MGVKLSGMVSGLDTDSIVKELMSAQSMKKTKVENKKTKLNWSQEKWKSLNSKLLSLYKGSLTKVKTQGKYSTKKVSTSDETKVSVTAGNSAAKGAHTLEVSQMASAQYLTGGVIEKTDGTVSSATTLKELGITENTMITIQAAKTSLTTNNSNTQKLIVGATTTISDLVTACQNAGLNANFDATQKRLFISSSDSGVEQQFSIKTTAVTAAFAADLTTLKHQTGYSDSTTTAVQKTELDNCYNVLASAATDSTEYTTAKNTLITYGENNTKTDYATKFDAAMKAYKATLVTNVDETMAAIEAGVDRAHDYKVVDGTAANIATAIATIKTNAGLPSTVSEQVAVDKPLLEATITSYTNDRGEVAAGVTADGKSLLTEIGLAELTGGTDITAATEKDLTLVTAKDAIFKLDGATMTDSSNNFTINYMTFDLKGTTTAGSPLKITVVNDTDSTYNMVKDFVKEFNSVLKEMNEMYYASTAKGYTPLTSEQKEAMTDDEVEKWENKIKDSLLRRDTTLGSLTTAMKTSLMGKIQINGKDYSLTSFGIHTSDDFSEKGLLHIYGDSEDDTYSTRDNTLKSMLDSDPNLVMKGLSELTTTLYNKMKDKMGKTELSSSLTFYNDVQMKKWNDSYEDDIDEWEDKLKDMENRYYNQFTQMEVALSKLQNQTNSLTSMLGSG